MKKLFISSQSCFISIWNEH